MIIIPKAILFDLDDTLITHKGVADKALETACSSLLAQRDMPFDHLALIRAVNEVRAWFWRDPERHRTGRLDLDNTHRTIFSKALAALSFYDDEAARFLAEQYGKRQEDLTRLFPKTVETLDTLQKTGYRMGLVTNGSSQKQRAKISKFSLEKYFEFCLIEGEAGFGKPDPRIYEKALSLLRLKAREVWMVGDNLSWDVEAPKKLGINAVWAHTRNSYFLEQPDIIPDLTIRDIAELPALLGPTAG